MVEISVIYYVCNNQIFIEESLESIVNQSFDNMDIICINDASTDDSLKLLKQYDEKYDNLTVNSIEYAGFADAINNVIKQINSKYVYITTPACILDEDALEKLYIFSEKNNSDLAVSDMKIADKNNKKSTDIIQFADISSELLNMDYMNNLLEVNVSILNKFFSLDFIRKNNIKFSFDERSFVFESLLSAEKIAYVHEKLFRYNNYYVLLTEKSDSQLFNTINFSNQLIVLFKKYGMLKEYKKRLYDYKISLTIDTLSKVREKNKEKYFNELRQDFKKILMDEKFFADFTNNISYNNHKHLEQVLISENLYEYTLLRKTYYELNRYYTLMDDKKFYENAKERHEKNIGRGE